MNEIHPWDAQISWELPFYSSDRIWGWQIRLVGLHGDVNFQYCAQINSKDEILNWTIPGLAFGATYTVNLQSLPSGHGKKGFSSNTITKKLTIPSWQDMCTSVGYECKWEICWPVENVTVEIENKAIPIVTWRPSKYHKSVHYYEVSYRNKNSRDYIKVSVQNVTRLILDKIKPQNTTHYYVKVRPVFADYRQGMYSKEIEFIIDPIIVPPGPALNKIIISCSIASSILVFILILLVIRTKNKPNEGKKLKPPPLLPDNEVLIVHDEHCTLCDNVTHSLTNVLNETGYIKCVLDLCCTNEIAEKGYCWYEEKLRNCSKVLVICTKEGRKIYEGRESYNTVKRSSRTYIAILKMILGGKFHNNKTEVVPVCFDHSSHEDIPYFLSDRPFYSLPSEIEKLLMSLSGFNSRSVGDFTEYEIDNTDVLRKKINELKNAIANVGKNHYGNGKVTLVKFFGRSLSGSSTEESSV